MARKLNTLFHVTRIIQDWDCVNYTYSTSPLLNITTPFATTPCWRHQMETFSALPRTKASVAELFFFFFDLRLNQRLSKDSWGWWFEKPLGSLWHHCICHINSYYFFFIVDRLWDFDMDIGYRILIIDLLSATLRLIGPWEIWIFSDWWLRHLLWNCPDMNVTRPHWWSVNIGSGDGLVPSGKKPLPESMLTEISVAVWRHEATTMS